MRTYCIDIVAIELLQFSSSLTITARETGDEVSSDSFHSVALYNTQHDTQVSRVLYTREQPI